MDSTIHIVHIVHTVYIVMLDHPRASLAGTFGYMMNVVTSPAKYGWTASSMVPTSAEIAHILEFRIARQTHRNRDLPRDRISFQVLSNTGPMMAGSYTNAVELQNLKHS